ncbi:hypothetical protein ACQKGI_20380 [Peribacillus muralis]|uniref:hypothetical protein n=1 Tax=Peribacillus muralis TaxID=264697 RepID=UPI003816B8B2
MSGNTGLNYGSGFRSEVNIVGRREASLKEAKQGHPAPHARVCDVSNVIERIVLFEKGINQFP